MLLAGHFLQTLLMKKWGYDLKEHLDVIVLFIIGVTTIPILWKIFFNKKKTESVPSSTES